MYEAQFYTPDDFNNSSSEEHLEVYWGEIEGKGWRHTGSLTYLLWSLNLEADLPGSPEQRRRILLQLAEHYNEQQRESHVVDSCVIDDWMAITSTFLNMPSKPFTFDLSFVEAGWHKSGSLDEIFIGQGSGRWIVVHWYSTA